MNVRDLNFYLHCKLSRHSSVEPFESVHPPTTRLSLGLVGFSLTPWGARFAGLRMRGGWGLIGHALSNPYWR
jgi:hypothetical protein